MYKKKRIKRRSSYKRNYQRKLRRYKRNSNPSASRFGTLIVPDLCKVKLRYTERLLLTSTSGVGNSYQYSGNSLFDPNVTGVGAQPEGFDQLAQFYLNYRVSASKINIKVVTPGTTVATQLVEVCLVPTDMAGTYSAMEDARAAPYAKFKVDNLYNNAVYMQNYMTARKLFGLTRGIASDNSLFATTTSSPALQWYWNIVVESADRTSSTNNFVYVTITYYAQFFSRRLLALS